jgi:probable phosphoglycerate mutase
VEGRFQGRSQTPLSRLGRRQAAALGARLARPLDPPALPVPAGPPETIVHSPLRRAAETAAAIADAMAGPGAFGRRPPLRPEPGFMELAQGEWEGLRHAEIVERYGAALAAWRRRPVEAWAPGGESIPEAAARLRPALGRHLAALSADRPPGTHDRRQVPGAHDPPPGHPWGVIVGHDGIFKVLLLTLFDLPLERFWSFPFALAGITVIELRAGRPTLRAHNLVDHLVHLADNAASDEARGASGAL